MLHLLVGPSRRREKSRNEREKDNKNGKGEISGLWRIHEDPKHRKVRKDHEKMTITVSDCAIY
jgi:hypothetical protein